MEGGGAFPVYRLGTVLSDWKAGSMHMESL